jgi:hypothetical protein
VQQLELMEDKVDDILIQTDIKGTIQTPTYTGDDITKIVHSYIVDGTIARTDNLTYSATLITETRTITSGSALTFNYYFNVDGSYNHTEVI